MSVAVCICTRNRPKLLAVLLSALGDVDLSDLPEVEILVIDNAPDSAREVCRAASNLSIPLHYIPEPHPGCGFARNTAIYEAVRRGAEFVAFLDDDDTPEPDWLQKLFEKQRETNADIVFGAWRQKAANSAPKWAVKSLDAFTEPVFGEFGAFGDSRIPRHVGTLNILISCEFLSKLSAPIFDPGFLVAEDKDFFIRASQAGASMALADQSIVNRGHGDRESVWNILRRAFRNGRDAGAMAHKHCSPSVIRRKRRKAFVKLAIRLMAAPFYIVKLDRFMRNIYFIARGSGSSYFYVMAAITKPWKTSSVGGVSASRR